MISRPARLAMAGSILLLDRFTKHWIEQYVGAWDTHVVVPSFFYIVHAQNRGAAFGFLNQSDSPWRTVLLIGIASLVMTYVAYALWRLPGGGWPAGNGIAAGLSLVLGGAAGNLYDRIWRGSVTDFLQFYIGSYEWPSFNVADSAISVGAVLLILTLWRMQPATVS